MLRRLFKAIILTYLSRLSEMELAPFSDVQVSSELSKEVVKASKGHFPQPFLISNEKELVQR